MKAPKRIIFIILFILTVILSIIMLLPVITLAGHVRYINLITPMFEFCNKILE